MVLIVNKDDERSDIFDETRRSEDKYNKNITPNHESNCRVMGEAGIR